MNLPSWREWLFSIKSFTAAMLALYIGLALDLSRPYWAMAAVYIVSNPLAGATSSKALYRVLGTLIGACGAVLIVPTFINAPELMSLVIALWTGTLLFISMLYRTARSYVFMLAGYTLPMIALTTVSSPGEIFDVALARSEEILLGIVCAAVVHAIILPVSVHPVLGQRINSWLDSAGQWADEILRGQGAIPTTPVKRQQLAVDVSGLDQIIAQLAYDAKGRDVVKPSRELRGRLLMLLPLFSSLADRMHALRTGDHPLPAEFALLLEDVAAWLSKGHAGETDGTAEQLSRRITVCEDKISGHDWPDLLLDSALSRLGEIVDLWQDCLTLRNQIADGHHPAPWTPKFTRRRLVAKRRHYDLPLQAVYAGLVVLGIVLSFAMWIYTGWDYGSGFVIMFAVACSFFVTLDRPAMMISKMLIWTAVSLVLAFVYLFGILPAISSFEQLVAVFLPPFLFLGLLIPKPQYMLIGLMMIVNSANFVALADRYSADMTSFANQCLATVAGLAFALVWTQLVRPFGAELAAWRLVRSGWRDLAAMAAGHRRTDQHDLAALTLDRLGQLVPRLGAIENREIQKVDGFAEVRLGLNVVALQQEVDRLNGPTATAIATVLDGVAEFYRQRLDSGHALDPDTSLMQSIDEAIELVFDKRGHEGRTAIDALVGVRRVLFPDADAPDRRPDEAPSHSTLPLAAE